MRIVGGQFRGRSIYSPKGMKTRPTTDRTRESLFNILSHRASLEGARVLDLFAGTGALGLEALSRGASLCWFVENERRAQQAIKRNIDNFGLAGQARILFQDATHLASTRPEKPFDLVFADPPYGLHLGEKVVRSLLDCGYFAAETTFILEESSRDFPEDIQGLKLVDKRTYGETTIGLFESH